MATANPFSYLCSYDGKDGVTSKKVIRVQNKSEVIPSAIDLFNIAAGACVSIRVFDEEFEEYVNVDRMEDLPRRGKLLLVASNSDR